MKKSLLVAVVVVVVVAIVFVMNRSKPAPLPSQGEGYFMYGMGIADVKPSEIVRPTGPTKENSPEANVDSFVDQFKYPSGYELPQCLDKDKSDYVDDRHVLVTDGNGKPIEQRIRIAYPRVYGISGHENKPYTYQDFSFGCENYPDKLEIDQLGSNNFIPRFKNICG